MNTENRYPVSASLFMLREIKQRQEKVNKGYQLLKRKAEGLRTKGRQAAAELATTQAILGHTLKEAYFSLAAIKFTNGESNALILENVGQTLKASAKQYGRRKVSGSIDDLFLTIHSKTYMKISHENLREAQIRVQRIPENISGVATVSLEPVEVPSAYDMLQFAGLGAGGHRTGEAKRAFREAIMILIKFASLRNICLLLDEELKSTLRKVNGIAKVIMPKLHNTESYIVTEIDEREREEFHRLKMVKAKKNLWRDLSKEITKKEQICRDASKNNDNSPTLSVGDTNSLECLGKHGLPRVPSTTLSGDCKPICYPHNWDDEDLLF